MHYKDNYFIFRQVLIHILYTYKYGNAINIVIMHTQMHAKLIYIDSTDNFNMHFELKPRHTSTPPPKKTTTNTTTYKIKQR